MSSQTELEQRLAIVVGGSGAFACASGRLTPSAIASAVPNGRLTPTTEVALSQLQQQISTTTPSNWIAQIAGTFKDEPAFDEILA